MYVRGRTRLTTRKVRDRYPAPSKRASAGATSIKRGTRRRSAFSVLPLARKKIKKIRCTGPLMMELLGGSSVSFSLRLAVAAARGGNERCVYITGAEILWK